MRRGVDRQKAARSRRFLLMAETARKSSLRLSRRCRPASDEPICHSLPPTDSRYPPALRRPDSVSSRQSRATKPCCSISLTLRVGTRTIRFVRPKGEIVFACRLRWIATRLKSDQCLLHVSRSTAKERGRSAVVRCRFFIVACVSGWRCVYRYSWVKHSLGFQRRSGASSCTRLAASVTPSVADSRSASNCRKRDRAMLDRSKIKRVVFAHDRVAFALASLSRGAFVQLLHAAIEGANFFLARKFSAAAGGGHAPSFQPAKIRCDHS